MYVPVCLGEGRAFQASGLAAVHVLRHPNKLRHVFLAGANFSLSDDTRIGCTIVLVAWLRLQDC